MYALLRVGAWLWYPAFSPRVHTRQPPAYSTPSSHLSPLRHPRCVFLVDGLAGPDGMDYVQFPPPLLAGTLPDDCEAVQPPPPPVPSPSHPVRVFALVHHYDNSPSKLKHLSAMLESFVGMERAGYIVTVLVATTHDLSGVTARFSSLRLTTHHLDASLQHRFAEAARYVERGLVVAFVDVPSPDGRGVCQNLDAAAGGGRCPRSVRVLGG